MPDLIKLRTDREPGDYIESRDINQIAEAVNHLASRSGTSVTLGAPVAMAADLPATGIEGEGRIAQDTQHLWQWDGTTWVDIGLVAGPKGDPGLDAASARSLVASIGDSISWRNKLKLYPVGGSHASSTGWIHWANAELGHRITEHGNFAVSGKRTDEMLTEQLPAVLALDPAPGWCTVLGGTNDLAQDNLVAFTQANLRQIFDGLESQGIGIIACTVPPVSEWGWERKNNIYRINGWLRDQARVRRNFILVDWFAMLSTGDGEPISGVMVDGLHQSVKGAAIMGQAFAAAVRDYIPAIDVLPMPGDFRNQHPNPGKGAPGNGVGPDLGQTPNVAAGHRVSTADASTLDATVSKVLRTDGVMGFWQAIQIHSGNARETNLAKIPAVGGETWQAAAEIDIDPLVVESGQVTKVSLLLAPDSGNKTASFLDSDIDVPDGYGPAVPVKPGRMVLQTPPVTLAEGVTGLYSHVRIYGPTGSGQVRIGRRSAMKVPPT